MKNFRNWLRLVLLLCVCAAIYSSGCESKAGRVNPPAKPLPVVKTELHAALPAARSVIAQFPVKEQFYWEVSIPDASPNELILRIDLVSSGFELGEMHSATERIPRSSNFRVRITPLLSASDVEVKLALIQVPDGHQRVLGPFIIQAAANQE